MYIYKGYEIPENFMEIGLGYKAGYESPFMVINHESGKVYKRIEFTDFTLSVIMTGVLDQEFLIGLAKSAIDKMV